MAHTLTWNANSAYISRVEVNGQVVTQPYTLQDGDIIEVYAPTMSSVAFVNNELVYGGTFDYSNCDLYIDLVGGGAVN